jgi:site-specific recombinase XerD
MLRHPKINTTQIYTKLLENKIGMDIENLEKRLVSER